MSRALAAIFLLGLCTAGPVSRAAAQATPGVRDGGGARERDASASEATTLVRLENEWARALVRRDATVFRRLLAKGFVYTENDRMMGGGAVVRELTAGTDSVQFARNKNMRVHSFGTTAVVTGWLVVRGRGADGPFNRRYRFTDTWVRGRDGWVIVAAHDYLVPRGAGSKPK
ncbi:MAG: nuclear transport factor 2 family protein [Candidatus Eisenbacteria bacterium]|uniref:Nuclear transport factor 2 family protein n=1 Tax=Eiseniibacteriota bacterium TaxID=2212470 RepID=A0A538T5B5_UNCEI|nr:MAG: nuclear transport factor 2 family protein [Candidatus Eisenbacteria bacterium]